MSGTKEEAFQGFTEFFVEHVKECEEPLSDQAFGAVCRAFGVAKQAQEAFLAQGMAYSRICDLVNAEKTDLSEQGKKVVTELLA